MDEFILSMKIIKKLFYHASSTTKMTTNFQDKDVRNLIFKHKKYIK